MANVAAPTRRRSPSDVLQSIWCLVRERGLKVGDQLPSIRELAERLEIKPALLRDALLQAQAMGLVRILPRAGAFLQTTGPIPIPGQPDALRSPFPPGLAEGNHNLFHLLDARRLIEIELVGRAADCRRLEDLLPVHQALEMLLKVADDAPRSDYVNHDIRFHMEITRLAGSPVLFTIEQTLMELLRPHLNEVPPSLQRRSRADRSHVAIYEALVAGNADKARAEMREHLSLAYDSLLRAIQEPPVVGESKHGDGVLAR